MGDNSTQISLKEYVDMLDEETAIVGTATEDECSYSLGYISRQAVYSCLDCTPPSSGILAGFCFACSVSCHHDHNVEMIYTKRNFRCDCGTIPQLLCNLLEKPDGSANTENKYSHNFQGLYCTCHRPYPDPERPEMDNVDMIQCVVCEDWYHATHLNTTVPEVYEELICQNCIKKHPFLSKYRIIVEVDIENVDDTKSIVDTQEGVKSMSDTQETKVIGNSNQNISESSLHIADITQESNVPTQSTSVSLKRNLDSGQTDVSAAKKQKLDENNQIEASSSSCAISDYDCDFTSACYYDQIFRDNICKCVQCLELFNSHKIDFLLDKNDSIAAYEDRSKTKQDEELNAYVDVIESLPHQAKCDVARAMGGLNQTLTSLLQRFNENDGEVSKEEIQRAFQELADKTYSNAASKQWFQDQL